MPGTTSRRRVALVCAIALLVAAPLADGAKKPSVKRPKSGTWSGTTQQKKDITLYVSRNSVDLAAFTFRCQGADGRTSMNAMKLVKTTKGYKFSLKAHGSISFSDGQPDENGRVEIGGRFSVNGKTARGTFRVRSSRCHTGVRTWNAKR
jgi:hypothetical protein